MDVTIFNNEDFEEPNFTKNKIGRGGFGIVFQLKELKTDNYYAVKDNYISDNYISEYLVHLFSFLSIFLFPYLWLVVLFFISWIDRIISYLKDFSGLKYSFIDFSNYIEQKVSPFLKIFSQQPNSIMATIY